MVWHAQHPQKKLYQHIKRALMNCRMEMGRRGRNMERSSALWQVEMAPMGRQACPWAACVLLEEAILPQEGPASLFWSSDTCSLSTVPRTSGAVLGTGPGDSSRSEVILLYPGAGTPKPACLLKKIWNHYNLDLRVCVHVCVLLSQIIPDI